MSAGDRQAAATARVARAAGPVMVLFVASRGLGLLREMVISRQFGTSGTLDAYLAAFRLPDILFQVVAGGALASAFIPTFATYWERDDRAGAWRLASAVINLVFLLTVLLAAASWLLAPWLVRTVIAPGFGADRQALTASLMRIMLITPAVFGVSGVIMGILNARQHFALPALAPVLYNLGIIGGALLLAPSMDVRGLAVGVVAGSLGHLVVQVPALARQGMRYVPLLGLRDAGVREVGRLMVPRMVGLAAVQLNFLVNTILASGLAAGSISALNYAWLLMLLPQGVVAQAVATAAFPTFSAQAARGELAEMRSTLVSTLRAVLYLALPAAVGLVVLRAPLVEVIFQRGAFSAASTGRVAGALALYALGLPAHSAVEILVRAFYAMHDTRTPVGISAAAMALNIGLSVALMAGFGAAGWAPYGGLALANSLATTLEMGALLGVLRRRLGGLGGRPLGTSLARSGAASAAMAGLLLVLLRLLAGQSAWLTAGAGLAAGALAYAGLSLALGATEPQAMAAVLRRRGRTRGGGGGQ